RNPFRAKTRAATARMCSRRLPLASTAVSARLRRSWSITRLPGRSRRPRCGSPPRAGRLRRRGAPWTRAWWGLPASKQPWSHADLPRTGRPGQVTPVLLGRGGGPGGHVLAGPDALRGFHVAQGSSGYRDSMDLVRTVDQARGARPAVHALKRHVAAEAEA